MNDRFTPAVGKAVHRRELVLHTRDQKDLLGHQHVTCVGGNLKGSIFLLTGGRG
jgi:hypothetical protein